jgi:hypothetical protein
MNLRNGLAGLFSAFLLVLALLGCVEREFFIHSDPPGALVFVDGVPRGTTPLTMTFEHYGEREVELRLASYQVLQEEFEISPPWYQVFPLDFFCEVLLPFNWKDTHHFERILVPVDPEELESKEDVIERAEQLRRSS